MTQNLCQAGIFKKIGFFFEKQYIFLTALSLGTHYTSKISLVGVLTIATNCRKSTENFIIKKQNIF